MVETEFSVPFHEDILHGTITGQTWHTIPRVLFLHGGGASTSSLGSRYLRCALADQGIASAAFDFSGHGRSTGRLENASLRRRTDEALQVAAHLQLERPSALIATSMAGHIACRLIEPLRPNVLVLYAPAAYEERAEPIRFGDEFRAVIRSTRAFASSPAFGSLERFDGRLLVVYGAHDSIIPEAVQEAYASRAVNASSIDRVWLPDAGHKLHDWLAHHPREQADIARRVLAMLS